MGSELTSHQKNIRNALELRSMKKRLWQRRRIAIMSGRDPNAKILGHQEVWMQSNLIFEDQLPRYYNCGYQDLPPKGATVPFEYKMLIDNKNDTGTKAVRAIKHLKELNLKEALDPYDEGQEILAARVAAIKKKTKKSGQKSKQKKGE